ncbi:MAG: hypothetical protein WCP65_08230 [Bacteroidota bacterium]
MKKSKYIELVLITAALSSCHQSNKDWENANSHTYIRSDSSAPYSPVRHYGGGGAARMWYYAFRPYGNYNNGYYERAGYYSDAIHPNANIGSNFYKGSVVRGGFGSGGFSVSS